MDNIDRDKKTSESTNMNVDQIMAEAEQRFRQGLDTFNEWSTQAKEVIQKQPALVLAGVAVLGFVTGLLLRSTTRSEEDRYEVRH